MLTAKLLKPCFNFSQMTIADEQNNHLQYFKLSFVEFLEMVGRATEVWGVGRFEDNTPLSAKLEEFLDELLDVYGLKRCPISVDEESESQSDEDY